MHRTSQPGLSLIGLGVIIPDHITSQAMRAMSRCSRIYSIVQEPPRLWLPPNKLGRIEVFNVLEWYVEDSLRMPNYDRVASTIFQALEGGKCVGYVTYGNPMAYDRVAQNLVQLIKDGGGDVQIIPGVSSFDTVLCDLRVDMAPGIQVFDASWFVACRIEPRVDAGVLLMQVGAFGSLRTHYTKRQDGSSLRDLVQYCRKLYSASHLVSLVRSGGDEGLLAHVRHVPLAALGDVSADDLSGASLYIPPSERALPSEEFIAKMEEV
jgi:uncharacterized protein YabN with tetrapyrrole methylase and pyrophosphatase domain